MGKGVAGVFDLQGAGMGWGLAGVYDSKGAGKGRVGGGGGPEACRQSKRLMADISRTRNFGYNSYLLSDHKGASNSIVVSRMTIQPS